MKAGDDSAATTKADHSTASPAFQFYPRDFLASHKVDCMSMTERGIYMTLLSRCWLDGSLPTDLPQLARMARMKPAAFESLWTRGPLCECFYIHEGRMHNARLDAERRKQQLNRQRQSDNASKGWKNRKVSDATALSGIDEHQKVAVQPAESGNALRLQSSSASASSSAERGATPSPAPPRPMAPIHDRSHIKHAICGRVCIVATQFGEFVRRRNHDGADSEIRTWANQIIDAWTHGLHANDEPGDMYDFWRARYAETWPTSGAAGRLKVPLGRLPSMTGWECPHVDRCGHRAMCDTKSAMPEKYPVREKEPV